MPTIFDKYIDQKNRTESNLEYLTILFRETCKNYIEDLLEVPTVQNIDYYKNPIDNRYDNFGSLDSRKETYERLLISVKNKKKYFIKVKSEKTDVYLHIGSHGRFFKDKKVYFNDFKNDYDLKEKIKNILQKTVNHILNDKFEK